jgi:hypothetical protein
MTTHHKDDCPCGSGKRYKHCHMAADQAKSRRGWMAGVGVVGLLVVGAAAWGMYGQWQAGKAATGTAATTPGGAGGDVSGTQAPFGGVVPGLNTQSPLTASGNIPPGSTNELAPGENPTPWQYDVAKDRHYDPRPGHNHWHPGTPPSDTSAAAGGVMPTPTVTTTGGAGNISTTTTVTPTPISPNFRAEVAPGENPQPWEHDVKGNRHYNPLPGHQHWHPGPPPPASAR